MSDWRSEFIEARKDGLYLVRPPLRLGFRICGPLRVTACAGPDGGLVLRGELLAIDGKRRRFEIPRKLLASPRRLLAELFGLGLQIEDQPFLRTALVNYLNGTARVVREA